MIYDALQPALNQPVSVAVSLHKVLITNIISWSEHMEKNGLWIYDAVNFPAEWLFPWSGPDDRMTKRHVGEARCLTTEYTDSAVCGEGGIVHDSQPWSSSEEQGPSGHLEYYQGGVSPTTPWHLSVDDNGLGLSSFQRTRKWFLSSNESFNASNLGRGGTPLSFKYWEESLLSPLNDKMNIILKGKEDINLH